MKLALIDLGKAIARAFKGEAKEILELKPTEDDYAKAAKLAVVAATALTAVGLPTGVLGTKVLTIVFAYGLRDIKEGIEDHDNLLYKRIIKEINYLNAKGQLA